MAQIPPPPAGSIDPFIGWLLALVLGGFTAALGVMWKQSVAESKRKDQIIDRQDALIERVLAAGMENANANSRLLALLKEEKEPSR
jgi:hypothetical protein